MPRTYLVCSNYGLARSYVRNELKGNPDDRELVYVTSADQARGILLHLGDRVHKFSSNDHPMEWSLYLAWEAVERSSGLPVLPPPEKPK
jgi:hypothetical protein